MQLVKIRMLTTGPNENHTPDDILLVDEKRAAALVEGDHATYVGSNEHKTTSAKAKHKRPDETVAVAPPEDAALRTARPAGWKVGGVGAR